VNLFLKNMTATEQVGVMFVFVFGCLVAASIALLLLSLREHPEGSVADVRRASLARANALLRSSWVMVIVFWIGWVSGDLGAIVLFGLVSFFALREFMALSPTRRSDHRSLVLAFFVILPLQYTLVGTRYFDLFTVFIPVYVFLAIPVVSALADDPQRFLERNAKLQWGIMVCIYGMSHVPALLLLDFPNYRNRGAFLVFFLVLVVQTCMVLQTVVARRLQRAPSAPAISSSFNWVSWGIAVGVSSVLGALLAGITPFKPGQAFAMAIVACMAGSLGHLVMKAIKRDRGVPNWGNQGYGVTGANGLLDRVDALCFSAPVFFHSVRWYFNL
jgi:phosphatidate cytidylyltransferase